MDVEAATGPPARARPAPGQDRPAAPTDTAEAPTTSLLPTGTATVTGLAARAHPSTVLGLQRAVGNRAVTSAFRRPTVQRDKPTAPAAPAGPAAPANPVTAVHESTVLTPDPGQLRETLMQQVVVKGWDSARGWAVRFINMDMAAELNAELVQRIPRDALKRLRDLLNAELDRLTADRDSFLKDFEEQSKINATKVLDASEKEINEQLKSLGVKDDTFLGFKTGTQVMDKGKADGLKGAAQILINKRTEADKAAKTWLKAQNEAKAIFDKSSAPGLAEALPNVFLSPELAQRVESTKAEGLRLAREYDDACVEQQKTYPILATVSAGKDALAELMDLAARKPDDLATKIQLIAQDRLANITKVRGDLGGRFSVWKEPNLRNITKSAMKIEPWQSRVAEEKAQAVKAEEENTKMLMAAVAIGLGLIAAIPTAGASLAVAGVVTAAAVGSMVISVYGAYEHYQDYSLAAAAQGTSFDKAKAISQGEPPELFWLAVDIVMAITDISAAASAFKTVKTVLAEAKAAESAEKLTELVGASRKAGLAAETEGKLIAAAMGGAEDAKKVATSLEQIMQVFKRARKVGADTELTEAFLRAAEKAVKQEKVVLYAGSAEEKQAAVLAMIKRNAKPGMNVDATAADLVRRIEKQGTVGLYDPLTDTIIVKGDRSASSVAATLAHELAHQKQNLAVGLENISNMHAEFQAFYAQQQFLRNLGLPPHRIPKAYEWLITADHAAIQAHVAARYESRLGKYPFKNFDESADWIIKTMKGK